MGRERKKSSHLSEVITEVSHVMGMHPCVREGALRKSKEPKYQGKHKLALASIRNIVQKMRKKK